MRTQYLISSHKQSKTQYRRFCSAPIVDTAEVYVFCGEGWRNHSRKSTKGIPLCNSHLKSMLMRQQQAEIRQRILDEKLSLYRGAPDGWTRQLPFGIVGDEKVLEWLQK